MQVVIGHLFWDELLMFVVPVLLVLGAVRWAERRNTEETGTETPGIVPGDHPTDTRDEP